MIPSDTPHTVGLLWASDHPEEDLHLTAQHSQETDIHAPGRILTRNSSKRAAADPCLIAGGHWDMLCVCVYIYN